MKKYETQRAHLCERQRETNAIEQPEELPPIPEKYLTGGPKNV